MNLLQCKTATALTVTDHSAFFVNGKAGNAMGFFKKSQPSGGASLGERLKKYWWLGPALGGFAVWRSQGNPLTMRVSDTFFLMGIGYLVWGLWKLVGNLGLFRLVSFSTKKFLQVVLEHTSAGQRLPKTGDYLSYRRAFIPDTDYPALLLLGGALLLISLVFSFF